MSPESLIITCRRLPDKHAKKLSISFLFVSAPFSGIEVFFRNLLKVLQWRTDIETTWEWIDYQPKEFIARLPIVARNWSLKGDLSGVPRQTPGTRGRIFDAVLSIISSRFSFSGISSAGFRLFCLSTLPRR